MFDKKTVSIEWGGKTLTLETGKVARQADGAVIATLGETVVLCAVTAAKTITPSGSKPRRTPTSAPVAAKVRVPSQTSSSSRVTGRTVRSAWAQLNAAFSGGGVLVGL